MNALKILGFMVLCPIVFASGGGSLWLALTLWQQVATGHVETANMTVYGAVLVVYAAICWASFRGASKLYKSAKGVLKALSE